MIGERRRSNPLNLMRVIPPKEGPSRTGISAMRFSAHGFLFYEPRITRMKTDKHNNYAAVIPSRVDGEGPRTNKKRLPHQ